MPSADGSDLIGPIGRRVPRPFGRSAAAGGPLRWAVVNDALRSLWDEPRVPHPPARGWQDWALVSVLVTIAVIEALFRPDLVLRPLALVLGVAPLFTLLWRRSNPLVVVVIAFTAHTVVS